MMELEKLAFFAESRNNIADVIEKLAYENDMNELDVIEYVEKIAYDNDVDEMEVLADLEQRRTVNYNKNDGKVSKWIKEKTYGKKNLEDYNAAYDRLRSAKDSVYINPNDKSIAGELASARQHEEDMTALLKRRAGKAGLAAAGTVMALGAYPTYRGVKREQADSARRAAEYNARGAKFAENLRKTEEDMAAKSAKFEEHFKDTEERIRRRAAEKIKNGW